MRMLLPSFNRKEKGAGLFYGFKNKKIYNTDNL
jgi:hypothetical protein